MSGQITQNNQYKKIITNLILTCYNKFVIVKGEVLYRIEFYEDERGISSIKDFITELNAKAKTDKIARINRDKIVVYLDLLKEHGTRIGMPVIKHLDGEIWELRPLANRILFAYYKDDVYVLLHSFVKKTNKTPKSEIKKAKREIEDYKRRQDNDANLG